LRRQANGRVGRAEATVAAPLDNLEKEAFRKSSRDELKVLSAAIVEHVELRGSRE
jgi:hypothetical protein